MPFAYMDMIFWSMPEMSFWRFLTTWDSNVDFLSWGTWMSMLPKLLLIRLGL